MKSPDIKKQTKRNFKKNNNYKNDNNLKEV